MDVVLVLDKPMMKIVGRVEFGGSSSRDASRARSESSSGMVNQVSAHVETRHGDGNAA